MSRPQAHEGSRIVVLIGPGLTRASGVPDLDRFDEPDTTFLDRKVSEIACLPNWNADPESVRCLYDDQRSLVAAVMPNPGHDSLARLQHVLGPRRCTLVTLNVYGLLEKAAAHEVVEMRGSLWRLRCQDNLDHPKVGVFGAQSRTAKCAVCHAPLRPDVVWNGEPALHMAKVLHALDECDFFMSVGSKGYKEPALTFIHRARAAGAQCIEVNTRPHSEPSPFDQVIAKPAEQALPEVFGDWLGDEVNR